jgi:hypothetical protein
MLLPLLESVSVGPKLVIQTSTCLGVFDETSRQWDHMPIVGHPKSMLIGCDFDAGDITCKYLVRSALFFLHSLALVVWLDRVQGVLNAFTNCRSECSPT